MKKWVFLMMTYVIHVIHAKQKIQISSSGDQMLDVDGAVDDILNFSENILPIIAEKYPEAVLEFATHLKQLEREKTYDSSQKFVSQQSKLLLSSGI